MLTPFLHAQFLKIEKFHFLFFVILQIIFTNSLFADDLFPIQNSVRQVVAGDKHTCAVTTDNNLWCWGNNRYGQLGLGNMDDKTSPTQVTSLTDVASVSLGHRHTCAIKTNGTLWCWGYNLLGELGLGNTENQTTPKQVTSLTDVASVSLGGYHTCAIRTNGTLWCWGHNSDGQLGLGDSGFDKTRTLPTQVSDLMDVASIGLGANHTCAIKTNGTLWCWGDNYKGQLGLGNNDDKDRPTQVKINENENLTEVVSLGLGFDNTCVIKADGTLWCWGDMHNSTSPSQVSSLTDVVSMSLGFHHTCVIKADGTLWCWGNNNYGQLGLGDTDERTSPTEVTSLINVVNIGLGSWHSCVVRVDGTLWCFGDSENGQVGNGTAQQSSPVEIFDGTGIAPSFGDDCRNHWNYEDLQLSVLYNFECTTDEKDFDDKCKAYGYLVCYDGNNNPSIVCNAKSPNCCKDNLFDYIGEDCYDDTGLGEYKCSGEEEESSVNCIINATYTPTYTPSNTITPTNTRTSTNTRKVIPTKTFTPSNTFTNTNTFTITNTSTITNTPTITNTFTNTYTATSTYTNTNTYTNTFTLSNTPTSTNTYTVTPMSTKTFTPSFTFTNTSTPTNEIQIVTPKTKLPDPEIAVNKNILTATLPKIIHAAINEKNISSYAKFKYQVSIMKTKRKGADKNYKLKKETLTYSKKNVVKFKKMDKGTYAIKYRVVITQKEKTKYTKWSKKVLGEI